MVGINRELAPPQVAFIFERLHYFYNDVDDDVADGPSKIYLKYLSEMRGCRGMSWARSGETQTWIRFRRHGSEVSS